MTTAELPVQTIKNSNLAWVRQDLGPMNELVASIQEHGIQQPILLAPDYLVLDGARRLVAATKLKLQYVPVQICRDWPTLLKGIQANMAATDCIYPMTWLELRDLWDHVLKPVHELHRRTQTVSSRRRNKLRAAGNEPRSGYNYSGYTSDIASIYETPAASIKILRDGLRRLERLSQRFPVFGKGLYAAMQSAEPRARHVWHGRILKTMLDRVESGRLTEHDAVTMFERHINTATVNRPIQYGRRKRNLVNLKAPETPLPVVENLAELLTQVAGQAASMVNFHTTARHRKAYIRIIDSITASTHRLYRLRRRLESITQPDLPSEILEETPQGEGT